MGEVARTRDGRGLRLAATSIVLASVLAPACSKKDAPPADHLGESSAPLSSYPRYDGFKGGSLPAKTVALTFDDGPGIYASQISTYLKGQGIRAVFFINGNRVTTSGDLPNPNNITVTPNVQSILAQIIADGHLVANHTVTHRDIVTDILPLADGATQLFNELSETDTDINGYVPSGYYLFRAPYGSYNPTAYGDLSGTAMNKYIGPIYWDAGGVETNYGGTNNPTQAADWACWQGDIVCGATGTGCTKGSKVDLNGPGNQGYLTSNQCGDAYLAEINSVGRGVVLMHDPYFWSSGNTFEMVKYIVPKLVTAGYSFARIDDVPDIKAALPPCDATCATCDGVGSGYCLTCNLGRYFSGGSCITCNTCGPGLYQTAACTPTSNTVCAPCDGSCATCSGGGPTSCTSCAANKYLTGGGSCQACSVCAAGSYQTSACTATADTVCATCSAGTYSNAPAQTTCTSCDPGTYGPNAGATSCTPCAAGKSSDQPGETACTDCAAGSHSDAGSSACSTCSAGTYAASGSAVCTDCPIGTSSSDNAASCTACAAGSYAASPGAPTCTKCAAGSASGSPGATSCTPCVAGTAASAIGSTACTACAAGSWSGAGASTCSACGSCDDANACTTDSCDATKGCVHTKIAGCVVDAGSSGGVDAGSAGGMDGSAGSHDAGSGTMVGGSDGGSGGSADSGSDGSTDDSAPTGSDGGCGTAPGSAGGGATFLVALAVTIASRRRRSR
jgi:peptidoglycan/xylan/chitin deacetylase (PgdA/CDA1 family)